MSNYTSHYFGAYLEIKVRKTTKTKKVKQCANGHVQRTTFCSRCGLPVIEVEKPIEFTPVNVVDNLLDWEWVDILATITPPSLYQSGTIIAVGNTSKRGQWLTVGNYNSEIEMKPFPTAGEIESMIGELETNYSEIIGELRKHKLVKSVEVKAGYVLDTEY